MQNHSRARQTHGWVISIRPRGFQAQREIEKQLTSGGIESKLHTTAGVYCIWSGLPLSIAHDMKIYSDERILWLTKHCKKQYVVAFRTTLDEATELRLISKQLENSLGLEEKEYHT